MKAPKAIKLFIVLVVAGFIFFFAIAQQQFHTKNIISTKTEVPEDSVETLGTATTDDPWKEMKKLVDAYYTKEGITYNGTMKLIDDNSETEKIIEEKPFEYSVLKNNYFYSLGNLEVIHKKNYLVFVDHENKSVILTQTTFTKKQKEFFNIRDFKKLMEESKAEAKVTQLDSLKILTIDHIQDPNIQGYRIYYDPITYRIQKMLIGMLRLSPLNDNEENTGLNNLINNKGANDNPDDQETLTDDDEGTVNGYCYYLEISYKGSKTLSVKENKFNPEEKFISITESSAEIKPAFSSYEFISILPNRKSKDK